MGTKTKSKGEIRRRVRRDFDHGDLRAFKTKSFTDKTAKDDYHPAIDVVTFDFHCTCRDYDCRKRVCKHLKRAALILIKAGELSPQFFGRAGVKCCHHCGGVDRLFAMCYPDGSPMDAAYICFDCVQQARVGYQEL